MPALTWHVLEAGGGRQQHASLWQRFCHSSTPATNRPTGSPATDPGGVCYISTRPQGRTAGWSALTPASASRWAGWTRRARQVRPVLFLLFIFYSCFFCFFLILFYGMTALLHNSVGKGQPPSAFGRARCFRVAEALWPQQAHSSTLCRCLLFAPAGCKGEALTALRFDDSGMHLAVGTNNGRVALFDLRSQVHTGSAGRAGHAARARPAAHASACRKAARQLSCAVCFGTAECGWEPEWLAPVGHALPSMLSLSILCRTLSAEHALPSNPC